MVGAAGDAGIMTVRDAIAARLPRKWLAVVWRLRQRGKLAVGRGSYIHPRAQIIGRANVRIGNNTCISEECWLNVNHREPGALAIQIGANCFIGRQNFFSSGRSIRMGDYCLTTLGCRFICATHVADDPRLPYISTGTTGQDRIDIGTNCFFGVAATVLGNVSIGHGSVIGANAVVLADVPPFSLVVGSPARVIKRYSYARSAWIGSHEIALADLEANPGEPQYLESLAATHPRVHLPWLAAGIDFGSL
jgi:acetyltransferase-like isoleucine patch superfamily enzyme